MSCGHEKQWYVITGNPAFHDHTRKMTCFGAKTFMMFLFLWVILCFYYRLGFIYCQIGSLTFTFNVFGLKIFTQKTKENISSLKKQLISCHVHKLKCPQFLCGSICMNVELFFKHSKQRKNKRKAINPHQWKDIEWTLSFWTLLLGVFYEHQDFLCFSNKKDLKILTLSPIIALI